MNSKLEEIYTNVKSVPSYTQKVNAFLRNYKTSSIFKPVRKKFPRRKIVAHYEGQFLQGDTLHFRSLNSPQNRGYKYILVLIDCFSKKVYARALRRITDEETKTALEDMFSEMKFLPKFLATDKGKEFINRKVQDLLRAKGVKYFYLQGQHKASMAERVIRTLKMRIEKYLWHNNTRTWFPILKQFIENYNNSYHRSIKMAPNEVNSNNRETVFKNLYPTIEFHSKPKLSKGDVVRILTEKNIFSKGYKRSWSTELYKISKVYQQGAVNYYRVETLDGKNLDQKRYYYQLNLVSKNASVRDRPSEK